MTRTRIMLVEDEAITALCICNSLESLGYEIVATISRGAEAVRKAAELVPDLILMDITLADEMSGIEAAERILTAQQIPIIFMTAHMDSETFARAKRAEPYGYLTKPYNLDNLKNTIEVALYKSAADARVRESERHYRMLFESMRSGFALHEIICDPTGKPVDYRFLEINPAFEELTGKPAKEIVGKTVREIFPATEPYWIEAYGQVALSGEPTQLENFSVELQRHYEVRAYSPQPGHFATIIADITERKKTQEQLREHAEFLQTLLDTVPAPIFYKDNQGTFLGCNTSLLRCIGKEHHEVIGKNVFDFTPPELAQIYHRADLDLLRRGGTQNYEGQVLFGDGLRHDVVFSKATFHNTNGQPAGLIGAMIDLTELKRREEMALLVARGVSSQVGDDFFRSLTRHLAQVLGAEIAFIGALEGEEVDVIAGYAHGAELGELRYNLAGMPCAQFSANLDSITLVSGVRDQFPGCPLLQEFAVEGYAGCALRATDTKFLGFLIVLFAKPISDPGLTESLLQIFAARAAAELERRQTEQILLESESRYKKLFHEFETIVNGIPESLTLWSPEMTLLWANQGAMELHRAGVPELLGKDCGEVCAACRDGAEECEVRRSFRSQEADHGLRVAKDGRIWGVKTFPLKDGSGQVTRVIRLASDLTERMHLREEAARAAHLAALGELAAGVAHEINNPTGLILLEMPILRDAFGDAAPILEEYYRTYGDFRFAGLKYSEMRDQIGPMIDEIFGGAQRIKQIVMDLKDFSRPAEANPFVTVDLNEVVRKASSLVTGKIRKLTDAFTVVYSDEPVLVLGNFQKLEQVTINLIVNACQALADRSGQVEVRIAAAAQRRRGVVTVRDQGVGIRSDHLPLITDPFFTTRREEGGTGLGLSVSMRIVEEHGGTLRFDSTPGLGTLVTLEIPYEKEWTS